MADLKISALPASTVPLAGSEVLPIVQSGSTKQVSVGNLTAGRAVSASSFSAPAFKTPANNQTIINSIGATGVNYLQISDQVTGGNPNIVAYGTDANVGMNFATQGTGDFKFFTGNVVIGTSGKGIDFSATAGTGTSELLADYEEGTFTPTMFFGATQIDTYNSQKGWYTKTGNSVFFTIFIQLRTKGAGTGSVTVRNLPFTSESTGDHKYSFSVTGQNLALLTGSLFGVMDENTTQVSLFQSSAAGGTALTDAVFADFSSDNIIVTGTYQV
jgi:hypothetical protein